MDAVIEALDEIKGLLATAQQEALPDAAARLRAIIPPASDDLVALAEGLLSSVASIGVLDWEVVAAQIEGDLAGLSIIAEELLPPKVSARAPEKEASHALPEWVDTAMLAEFLDAQRHALTEIESLLLDRKKVGEAEQRSLARILHTLKGESGTVGFARLEELYHALEDRLEARGASAVVDELFAVKDWVLAALPRMLEGSGEPPGFEDLVRMLRGKEQPVAVSQPTPFEIKSTLPSDPEMLALFSEFYDEASESLTQADEMLVGLEAGPAEIEIVDALFRVFHTIKGLAGFLDLGTIGALAHAAETLLHDAREDIATLDKRRLDLLLRATATIRSLLEATRSAISSGSGFVEDSGSERLLEQLHAARVSTRGPGPARERGPSAPAPPPPPVLPAASAAEATPDGADRADGDKRGNLSLVRETIKVDLARVDSLVETIGELVIMEAMVSSSAAATSDQRTRQQLSQLSKIVRDLQRQGLALRMVPLRGVFQKMHRLVRDLSRRSGKPIELVLSGQDAEMDRSLAERLGDPLVHMMRNSVDHGIEPIERRRELGKPETARLRLSAYHEGGNIIIEIADDGKGLDRNAILRKAIERGLVPEGIELTDREVWDLIFQPGFSTASAVTELSGRGVGMDVVKRTVDELRGRIQIASEIGKGTTFRLVLPLTLAIIDGMLLVSGDRRYVLPTLSLLESLQPSPEQIHRFAGGERILDMRGECLPLVELGELLGIETVSGRDPTRGFVLVIDGLNGRFGLLVDDLIGQQQVVIKHIDSAVNQHGLFSGAAILSDGQVGLILNPAALRSEESRGATA